VRLPRSSGIVLHPTCLPGPHGAGDLGPDAYQFVDFLAAAGQGVWQVLPLGPTGYGDSPYQALSSFAGNPLMISLDALAEPGLLTADDLRTRPEFPADRVDFGRVLAWKRPLLERAAQRLEEPAGRGLADAFASFTREQRAWLDDYALFMALKEAHPGAEWSDWPADIALRRPAAVAEWAHRLEGPVRVHKAIQFFFHHQWLALRGYAAERGIRLLGDVPIFTAYDSADVWSHPDVFHLDDRGKPTVVAGVPPDAFSATGQLWGNPLYRWDAMAAKGFGWWLDRIRTLLALVDLLRIDHFIGFVRYWEVPAGSPTAVEGRFQPGPGAALARAIQEALGALPIVAEDLGLVIPEVEALRDQFEVPGMKVLQFAFGENAANPYLPHNYSPNCVVYTGTHDNDTTTGWFASAPPAVRSSAQRYLARHGDDIAYDLIRLAMGSVADTVIVPFQDVLALGSEARMNVPGRPEGNWTWRFRWDMVAERHAARLHEMAELYGRLPPGRPPASPPPSG
jgi:4-alpha-glucanotransferase